MPIAAVLTVTPGAATAIVVRSAIAGGWRSGIRVIAGNEVGVAAWALLSVVGVSALVAASEAAFVALKVIGACVLVWLGVQSIRASRAHGREDAAGATGVSPAAEPSGALRDATTPRRRRDFRDGVVTSLANPKLAVFFVVLFPQFVSHRAAVLPTTLLMAALVIAFDWCWYTVLAVLTGRAKGAFDQTRLARWLERITGTVLVGLGIRLAFEQR